MNSKLNIPIADLKNYIKQQIPSNSPANSIIGININGLYSTQDNIKIVTMKTYNINDLVYPNFITPVITEKFEDIDNSYNYCMITIVILAVLVYIYLQNRK